MKKVLLLLLLFIGTNLRSQYASSSYYLIDSLELSSLAQTDIRKLDSLLHIYHSTKRDSVKLEILSRLGQLDDFNTSWAYTRRLLAETKKIMSSPKPQLSTVFLNRKLGSSLYNMNYYFSMANMEDSSLKYLRLCIEPFRICNDQAGMADAYNGMGVYYSRIGKGSEALTYFQKGLVIFENLKDKKGIARAYTSIAVAYRDINEFTKAMEYCKKALKIYEELDDKGNLPDAWNQLGIIYKWSGDTANAEQAYQKSLDVSTKSNNKYGVAVAKLNLGIIMQEHGNYGKALINYQESLNGFKSVQSSNGVSYALNSLAITYLLLKQPELALKYANESHEMNLKSGYPESLINSSQVLGEIYEKLGKYKEANAMNKYYFKLKDSLQGVETQKKVLKTQLEFENQQKLSDIKREQDQKNLIAAQEKKQHQLIIIFVAAGLVVVIMFLLFLYNRFRLIKKQKGIIETQNHLVTEKNREILDSINYAKRLQEAILPSVKDVKKHLPGAFVYYQPKDIVAGDFFWMHVLSDGTVLFAVADSTGHGVPGALVSVVCSNALNRSVNEYKLTVPGLILDKTRELVLETFEKSNKDVKDGMDISLISISPLHNIQWAGANNPLWFFSNNEFNEIKADKQPVGKVDMPKPFTTHTIQLSAGDSVYLFTDGFADQFGGPSGKKFKYKPFSELLKKCYTLSSQQQQEFLAASFAEWKGKIDQVDDVCVAGIIL